VSILKFIERNWRLSTLSGRSLDNLPNPRASFADPYKPTNGPAIGDMLDFFDFSHPRMNAPALPLSD
jgi:phospholipase C